MGIMAKYTDELLTVFKNAANKNEQQFIQESMAETDNLNESFVWQDSSFYIHKLVKSNPRLDSKLQALVDAKIITDIKNVYLFSFLSPDGEYIVSFTGDLSANGYWWTALFDPTKAIINKRLVMNGISQELIMKSSFETNMFLSSGNTAKFKKIEEIAGDSISTTIPIPLPLSMGIYQKFKLSFDKPSKFLKTSNLSMSKMKVGTLLQAFSKSNYMFVYKVKPN